MSEGEVAVIGRSFSIPKPQPRTCHDAQEFVLRKLTNLLSRILTRRLKGQPDLPIRNTRTQGGGATGIRILQQEESLAEV
jgi:hypothetical protein